MSILPLNSVPCNKIEENIASISSAFQESRQFGIENRSFDQCIQHINKLSPSLRPIGHEGASMGYAYHDMRQHGKLKRWKEYFTLYGKDFHGFICAGVGWMLPKWPGLSYNFLKEIEPLSHWRVFDAWGYHDALFKSKLVLEKQDRSSRMVSELYDMYDQGIGRNIWYRSYGDTKNLLEIIESFDPARKKSLWRGIGIACIFVGGYDKESIRTILAASGQYKNSFKVGCVLGYRSLRDTHVFREEMEESAEIIFNKSSRELVEGSIQLEPGKSTSHPYFQWIQTLESAHNSLHKS